MKLFDTVQIKSTSIKRGASSRLALGANATRFQIKSQRLSLANATRPCVKRGDESLPHDMTACENHMKLTENANCPPLLNTGWWCLLGMILSHTC